MDWEANWTKLEASDNVFALVVMAQVYAKRLKDGATRKDVKIALIRLLYERGYSREQIVRLFNIIDWMLQLPRALESEFVQAVYAIQEEKHMPYVNTVERFEREKERQEGRHEGVEGALRKQIALKFGEMPDWADQRLTLASDTQLDEWVVQILTADSLEALLDKQ